MNKVMNDAKIAVRSPAGLTLLEITNIYIGRVISLLEI